MAIIAGHESTLILEIVQRYLSVLPIVCRQQVDMLHLLLRVLPDEGLNEESEERSSGGAHSPQLLSKRRMRSVLDFMPY